MLTKREKHELAQAITGLNDDSPWQGLAPLSRLADAGTDIQIDFSTTDELGAPVTIASRRAVIPSNLTKRQAQVCTLILQGQSNKEIARSLQISEATVKDHVHAILKRLGLKSRNEIGPLLHRSEFSSE